MRECQGGVSPIGDADSQLVFLAALALHLTVAARGFDDPRPQPVNETSYSAVGVLNEIKRLVGLRIMAIVATGGGGVSSREFANSLEALAEHDFVRGPLDWAVQVAARHAAWRSAHRVADAQHISETAEGTHQSTEPYYGVANSLAGIGEEYDAAPRAGRLYFLAGAMEEVSLLARTLYSDGWQVVSTRSHSPVACLNEVQHQIANNLGHAAYQHVDRPDGPTTIRQILGWAEVGGMEKEVEAAVWRAYRRYVAFARSNSA